MRIGLYFDLRNPGGARDWSQLYATTLDRIVDAERWGLDAVWLSEHHGFEDGYLPAPLTFAAAVAARTARVRIGTAVTIAPLTSRLALAEQAAVVDILSAGRLELGVGAGWRDEEFAAFGADFRGRYDALESCVDGLPELWDSGRASPAPVQRPLPTWVGARGPRGARIAGRTGAGLLWLDPDLLDPYREGLARGGHGSGVARMGGLVNIFLADDPEAAWDRIRPSGRRNRRTYRGAERSGARTFPRLQVLTPGEAAAHIREQVAGLPVSDVFCFGDVGGLEADLVDRHIELVTGALAGLVGGSDGEPTAGSATSVERSGGDGGPRDDR
ncbi:MAG: LLM class flavin-dependent oxidoreductase [Pseudonocardiaceae bacterium]|nr:LLM class flavin-dependent oxidoreductase [Pseudonocardiaceae bacterium]